MRLGLPIEDVVGKPEGVLITRLHGSERSKRRRL